MSQDILFRSDIEIIGQMSAFDEIAIKNEPMLFSCDLEHALKLGGPITKHFIEHVKNKWPNKQVVFDSRVHMLMKGWFPCIPGWHLDDVPRTRSDGQPEHINPAYKAEHIMAVVGDSSLTHFAVGNIMLTEPSIGETVYERWHYDIETRINSGDLKEIELPNLAIATFNYQTFHRGTPARKSGWRWFIRASCNTDRKVTNELRRQTQVYITNTNGGW